MFIVRIAQDDAGANFKEGDHPRDETGKFTAGGSSAPSYNVTNSLKPALKEAGFSKTKQHSQFEGKGESLHTYVHPSGAKVIVHPPESGKFSSKFSTIKPGSVGPKQGEGSSALAKLLKTAVEKAQASSFLDETGIKEEVEEPPSSVAGSKAAEALGAAGWTFSHETTETDSDDQDETTQVFFDNKGGTIKLDPNTMGWMFTAPGMGGGTNFGQGYASLKEHLDKAKAPPPVPSESNLTPSMTKFKDDAVKHAFKGGFSFEGNTITNLKEGSIKFENDKGAKLEINAKTEEWLLQTPGFNTKEGKGADNLSKILSGEPAVQVGNEWPWQNSNKTSLKEGTPAAAPSPAAALKPTPPKPTAKPDPILAAVSHLPDKKATIAALEKAAHPMNNAQKGAIKNYTGHHYDSINNHLRHGKALEEPGSEQKAIDNLQEYLLNGQAPEDLVIYRKVTGTYSQILRSIMYEGGSFQEKGFSSTSADPEVWHGDMQFVISIKKGQKGSYVDASSAHSGEKEFILPKDTRYSVKKIHTVQPGQPTYGGVNYRVHVEIDQSHL